MQTIHWKQKLVSEFMYNTFLSLVPSLLNPETQFERTPWGFTLGGERGVYIERRACLDYARVGQPYTRDLLRVLVLMVEFGAAMNIRCDGITAEYLTALEEVHTMYPLMTYEQQKQPFSKASG
jgi:hypothetical protein